MEGVEVAEDVAEATPAMAATEAHLLLRLDLGETSRLSMATYRLLQILRRREAVVAVVEEEGDVVDPIPIVAVGVLPPNKHRSRISVDIRVGAGVEDKKRWNTL